MSNNYRINTMKIKAIYFFIIFFLFFIACENYNHFSNCKCSKLTMIIKTGERGGFTNLKPITMSLQNNEIQVRKKEEYEENSKRNYRLKKEIKFVISENQCNELIKKIEDLHLERLKDKYDVSGILEGESFSISLECYKFKRSIYVMNDYIYEVDEVIKMVNEFIKDDDMKLYVASDTLKRWYKQKSR